VQQTVHQERFKTVSRKLQLVQTGYNIIGLSYKA